MMSTPVLTLTLFFAPRIAQLSNQLHEDLKLINTLSTIIPEKRAKK